MVELVDEPPPEDDSENRSQVSAVGRASEWVSRITTVVILMVGPGVLGDWADDRLDTQFLVLLGMVFGLVAGIYYLLKITKTNKKKQ